MIESAFVNISFIILTALGVAAVMRILRQPLIIGYIITGIIVGPYFLNLLSSSDSVGTFSKLGVALLLFTVGLHLNPKVIKEVGKVSLITGVGQVVFTSVLGFSIAFLIGFSTVASLYIAIALSFSSTIIIMKLLTDKGDIETVYGKISVGFLIVQDIIAVFALMIISSLSVGGNASSLILITFAKGVVATFLLFLFSIYVLPYFTGLIAKSQEFLFLFSISWCLALASLFGYLNFSIEIGALFAGIALSISPYSGEISSKLKPLRDFFIILFFIVIGSQMILGDIQQNIIPIILFSLFILVGNPLIVMVLMGSLGYTKRSGFQAGLTVAQISEFSIILIILGVSVGHLNSEILSLITMVGLITIAGSTYMISYSNQIYQKISKYLNVFERKKVKEKLKIEKEYDVILFGQNRIGFNILTALKKIKKSYLVVDYDPEVVSALSKYGVPNIFGDAYDIDFLEELPLGKAKIVISTIPDFEINELLVKTIKRLNKDAIVLVHSHQMDGASQLYEAGADYVLTPHFLGGEYVARMIGDFETNKTSYKKEKEKHMRMLKDVEESKRKFG